MDQMIKVATVTLAPGEAKPVEFQFSPMEARVYQVSVDGLIGSFSVIVRPTFKLSILAAKLYDARLGPLRLGGYAIFGKVDVTIKNDEGRTLTGQSPDYVEPQVTILRASDRRNCSFAGFFSDIPPGTNTITLDRTEKGWKLSEVTLSPGTFNYILEIKVMLLGWPGNPYVEAEFPGTTMLG